MSSKWFTCNFICCEIIPTLSLCHSHVKQLLLRFDLICIKSKWNFRPCVLICQKIPLLGMDNKYLKSHYNKAHGIIPWYWHVDCIAHITREVLPCHSAFDMWAIRAHASWHSLSQKSWIRNFSPWKSERERGCIYMSPCPLRHEPLIIRCCISMVRASEGCDILWGR